MIRDFEKNQLPKETSDILQRGFSLMAALSFIFMYFRYPDFKDPVLKVYMTVLYFGFLGFFIYRAFIKRYYIVTYVFSAKDYLPKGHVRLYTDEDAVDLGKRGLFTFFILGMFIVYLITY